MMDLRSIAAARPVITRELSETFDYAPSASDGAGSLFVPQGEAGTSGGLGPCFGMAIAGRNGSQILHVWPHQAELLVEKLFKAIEELGGPEKVQLYAGGAEPNEFSKEGRALVLRAFKHSGVPEKQVFVRWCLPGMTQVIAVDHTARGPAKIFYQERRCAL